MGVSRDHAYITAKHNIICTIRKGMVIMTQLLDFMNQYHRDGWSRFHMPGHKGNFSSLRLTDMQRFDITEIAGADCLCQAKGVIRSLERQIADFYGASDTIISAGGCTLCIQTMLAAVLNPGDEIIAVRNAHVSFINSCILLSITPHWIFPEYSDTAGVSGTVKPAQIAEAIAAFPRAKAVYLTSPDYLGRMADIASIAEICRRNGILFLVDNAHGAALVMSEHQHPMALGANLCCDSAHKTLPVFTGGAFLHLSERFSAEAIKEKMSLFGSTSPSYLIMLSIELCMDWLEKEGKAAYAQTARQIRHLKEQCRNRSIPIIDGRCEPFRLSVATGAIGYTDEQAGAYFRSHFIEPEYVGGGYSVFMASPFNTSTDWERLDAAIMQLDVRPTSSVPFSYELPEVILSPRDAAFSLSESVPVQAAAGRIAAQTAISCPPGVPIVIPGEKINNQVENILKNSGFFMVKVVK